MARGGGIEIPITVDASDLPRARKQIDTFLKGIQKAAGKHSVIDVISGKEGGKAGTIGSLQGTKGLQRYFDYFVEGAKKIHQTEVAMKKLSVEIKKGDKAAEHYVKTLRMVTTGKQIGSGLAIQVGQFYTQAPKTMQKLIAQWNKYGTQLKDAGLTGQALLDVQAKRAAEGKKIEERLAKELKQTRKLKEEHRGLEGQHRRLKEQYKDTLTYKVRELKITQLKAKWTAEVRRELNREKMEYQRLLHLQRTGLITEQQKVTLVKLSNDLTQRGIILKARETKEWKKIAREAKKISERRGPFPGGGLVSAQRLGWFIQLRFYWSLYRVMGALTERLIDLDEATARAMRTTREAGVSYEDMAKRVTKAVKKVASQTGASYRDVGEAQYQLTSAGLSAQEAFSGLSTVMKVAVLTETDVTAATKLVAGVYNNLKDTIDGAATSTEAMQMIGRTLIYTWQNNQVELSELTAALNQSIQSGKQAGLTFDELAIILGNLGTFMIRGGRGGRSLRNIFINLIRDAEKAKEIFHLTKEELDISGPIDFIALFRKMSTQWQAMGKEANKFQQAMELVRRRAGEAFVAILEGWDRIEWQLEGVKESHVSLEDEIINLTTRYRTLGKVISAEIGGWIDDTANYMTLLKQMGVWVLLFIRQQRAYGVTDHPERLAAQFGRDPAAMEEAAREYAAWAKVAERSGFGADSDLVLLLKSATKQLKLMATAIRLNVDDTNQLYIGTKKLRKARDVRGGLFRGAGDGTIEDPYTWSAPGADKERKKIIYWQKARSSLESEWVTLLNKESNIYQRLEAARSQYERDWKNFLSLTAETATEVRGQALKAVQKTHAQVFRMEKEVFRFELKMQKGLEKALRAGLLMRLEATRKGLEEYISVDMKRMQERVTSRIKYQISLLQQQYSIEQKRGVNAVDTLRQEISLGERNLKLREQQRTDMRKTLGERREQLEWLEKQRAQYGATTKEGKGYTSAIKVVEQQIRTLEDALRDSGQATALFYFQVEELKRRLQELQSPVEQMSAGVRRLQVQWEDAANDFEGLAVSMGQAFENNLSSTIADWVDGTKSAKDAWSDFAESFLREINRMIIKMIVAKVLASALGFATGGGGGESAGMYDAQTPAGGGQVYISRARGGILPHIRGFRSMSRGGVTGGPTAAILGDNKSGRELVIPEENIQSDEASGYVRGGERPINIVNLITQEDIAAVMAQDTGERVIINTIGKDIAAKKSTYHQVKQASRSTG